MASDPCDFSWKEHTMRGCCVLFSLLLGAMAFGQNFSDLPFNPKPVEAKVPWYTVKPDLSNVSNGKILPKLNAVQQKALTTNSFLALPTGDEQLFYIYENNTYKKIPTFVTTDSVMHTYHIVYDFTLRYLEQKRLFPAVTEFSARMLDANLVALKEEHPPRIEEALSRNVIMFAVPLRLQGINPAIPATIMPRVEQEMQRVKDHKLWTLDESNKPLFSFTEAQVNYTQFVPRGHYTRSKELEQYFLAMMWYGLVPMNLLPIKDHPDTKYPVLQALIITEQLSKDEKAQALWQQLYDPTVFYVGKADDLSYYQLQPLLGRIFGAGKLERFDDAAKIARFREAIKEELPAAGIQTYNFFEGGQQGPQFRIMGQRFIPDSRMLQELTWDRVGTLQDKRYFPLGLVVFAVLGSPRAAQLLDVVYKEPRFEHYLEQRKKLQAEFAALTPEDWRQNLYYGWMYCLLPMLKPAPAGYPAFMRGIAWQDKSLVTALGSWTELRHDTILYAKQSMVAECGEGEGPPPPIPGYVEPQVEVYERLSWLLKLNKAGLIERKLCEPDDELAASFDRFVELTDLLAGISRKELLNAPLSRDELHALETYGGELEWLMLSMNNLVSPNYAASWWEIESKTDRSMAVVADVHTANDEALEEAIGNAAEIWVVVPINGKLIATRGATFTYYEFKQPANNRLTDEAWQQQLKKGTAPIMPPWTKSFLFNPGNPKTTPRDQMQKDIQTGC